MGSLEYRSGSAVGHGAEVDDHGDADPTRHAVDIFRGRDGFDYVIKSNSWQGGGLAIAGANGAFGAGRMYL